MLWHSFLITRAAAAAIFTGPLRGGKRLQTVALSINRNHDRTSGIFYLNGARFARHCVNFDPGVVVIVTTGLVFSDVIFVNAGLWRSSRASVLGPLVFLWPVNQPITTIFDSTFVRMASANPSRKGKRGKVFPGHPDTTPYMMASWECFLGTNVALLGTGLTKTRPKPKYYKIWKK